MAVTLTRCPLHSTTTARPGEGWESPAGCGKLRSSAQEIAERDRRCRTVQPGTEKSEERLSAHLIDAAYERAMDELFGVGIQDAPPAASPAVRGPEAAVPVPSYSRHTIPDTCHVVCPAVPRNGGGNTASAGGERDRTGWASRLCRAVALCSVALGCILFLGSTPRFWRADATAPPLQPNDSVPVADVAGHDRGFVLRPIEEVQVGDRVAGTNPLREQAEQIEPDPASWRKPSFRMRKEDGLLLWIDLLRTLAWVEANEIELGRTAFLNLPDMGAVGNAEVTAVAQCPPIMSGSGTIVTGKFVHQSGGSDVVRLRLTGQRETTGVTRDHPYWSLDRKEFVKVGDLRIGETVDTEVGPRPVLSVEVSNYSGLLYNLETTEHVYRVATEGALVHNACGVYRYRDSVTGAYYIGSSNKIARRLLQHGAKVIPGTATTLKNMAQASTRVQLHVQEQIAILRAGGIKNLSNKINAVGMARAHRIPSAVRRRYDYYP